MLSSLRTTHIFVMSVRRRSAVLCSGMTTCMASVTATCAKRKASHYHRPGSQLASGKQLGHGGNSKQQTVQCEQSKQSKQSKQSEQSKQSFSWADVDPSARCSKVSSTSCMKQNMDRVMNKAGVDKEAMIREIVQHAMDGDGADVRSTDASEVEAAFIDMQAKQHWLDRAGVRGRTLKRHTRIGQRLGGPGRSCRPSGGRRQRIVCGRGSSQPSEPSEQSIAF